MQHPVFRWFVAGAALTIASAIFAVPASAAAAPALLAGAPQQLSAPVGGDFDVTLSVTNTGSTPMDGVAVFFGTKYGFEAAEQFSNCTYDSGQPKGCTFDQTLEPGRSYRFTTPYRVRADTYAPGALNGQFEWLTPADFAKLTGLGTAGSGSALALEAGDQLGASQDGAWQTVDVGVTGTNGTDLSAIGSTVSGTVGDVVTAQVGVHNNGPATLDWSRSGTSPANVIVTIPAGTSVVSAPACGLTGEKPGEYDCDAPVQFRVGATATWTFTLKIDKVVANAPGTVAVNPPCECQRFSADLDKSNDQVPLVVNASEAPVDQTAPVIEDTGIVEGQLAPAVFIFRPTVTDNVRVTKLEATENGLNLGGGCTLQGELAGCKLTLGTLPDDRDATITLKASDAAGNHSEKSVVVHVDNVAPTGTLAPAMGSSMRQGPVTVTVNNVAADTARIVMEDATTKAELAERTEAPWTFTWDAVDNATAPWFVITDRAGNTATRPGNYIVDDDAPVIASVDFAGSYSTNRLDTGAGWVGKLSYLQPIVQDASPIARSEWRVNGVLTSTDATFFWDATKFAASTATVELRVWDAAGNTSSKSFRVNIDRAGPAMTVTPGQRALIRGKTYITTLKASDPHGVAYTYLTTPAGVPGPATSAKLTAGKDGTKTLVWLASDKLGNEAYVTRTVIVDNTLPALTVTKAPKNKAKVTKTTTLKASSTDHNGVAKVQLLVNGKVVATDTKAGYTFSLNPRKYGKTFTVQLRSYDKAGNVRYAPKRTYHR